jgi:hypothetical protein
MAPLEPPASFLFMPYRHFALSIAANQLKPIIIKHINV